MSAREISQLGDRRGKLREVAVLPAVKHKVDDGLVKERGVELGKTISSRSNRLTAVSNTYHTPV